MTKKENLEEYYNKYIQTCIDLFETEEEYQRFITIVNNLIDSTKGEILDFIIEMCGMPLFTWSIVNKNEIFEFINNTGLEKLETLNSLGNKEINKVLKLSKNEKSKILFLLIFSVINALKAENIY